MYSSAGRFKKENILLLLDVYLSSSAPKSAFMVGI
jgi:hypothetical protein